LSAKELNEMIVEKVNSLENWMIEIRRDIHRHPEPSRSEFRTSKKVEDILKDLGVEVKTGFYNTGLTGLIRGKKKGRTLAFRFDMDALEMDEETGLDFASKNEGVMHACGHDGHTAVGLALAKILVDFKEEINGNIKLIFQPAEEDAPHGGGAKYMIQEGVLSDPDVSAAVGIHLWPALKLGEIGAKTGPMMAASDPITVEVTGKGAHASLPNLGIDPVVAAAQIVNNLQTIVSRNVDPFEQAVVTIGKFIGGTRYNTIPGRVNLEGTVRTFNEEVRDKVEKRIKQICEKTAEAMGASAEVDYSRGYPPTVNDEKMVNLAARSARDILGEDAFVDIDRPAPGGEDFAYFTKEIPSVYMWLGYSEEDKEIFPPHSPKYNFNEKALSYGVRVLSRIALNWR